MNFQIDTSVPMLTVLLQGLLSFFSPCVLPLLPLYVGYLAGGARIVGEDGSVSYPRKKVLINTLFFVVGISAAFFLLGFGFTALGKFFSGYRVWFARISGIIIILFGLYQLGLFGSVNALSKERRLPFSLDKLAMNPLTAWLMGFTFSFAWTPCVGPALTSVLLMAGSSASSGAAALLIGAYTLGFAVPFLLVGVFTGAVLDFFKRHMNVVKYTVKIGGVLMIIIGVMLLTGLFNGVTSYLSGTSVPGNPSPPAEVTVPEVTAPEETLPPAPNFTLTDQYGEEHKLEDYKGKTVFLNFWATWCGPCQREMPDVQKLYEEYGLNEDDLVVLGVANPKTDTFKHSSDGTIEEVTQFLTDGGYTYPVLMDDSGAVFSAFGVSAFPTTFMIDTEGRVFGYVQGMLTYDIMESIVQQTMTGVRE